MHSVTWPMMPGAILYGIISIAFAVWFTAMIRTRRSGPSPRPREAGIGAP